MSRGRVCELFAGATGQGVGVKGVYDNDFRFVNKLNTLYDSKCTFEYLIVSPRTAYWTTEAIDSMSPLHIGQLPLRSCIAS